MSNNKFEINQEKALKNLKRIIKMRIDQWNMTQAQVAEKCYQSPGNLSRILTGDRKITIEIALRCAKSLLVNPIDIDPGLRDLLPGVSESFIDTEIKNISGAGVGKAEIEVDEDDLIIQVEESFGRARAYDAIVFKRIQSTQRSPESGVHTSFDIEAGSVILIDNEMEVVERVAMAGRLDKEVIVLESGESYSRKELVEKKAYVDAMIVKSNFIEPSTI